MITYPCTAEEIGNLRVFCICDNRKPAFAWVIVDREVLAQYKTANAYIMVPAFLLSLKSTDDWEVMMKKATRQASWSAYIPEENNMSESQSDHSK